MKTKNFSCHHPEDKGKLQTKQQQPEPFTDRYKNLFSVKGYL